MRRASARHAGSELVDYTGTLRNQSFDYQTLTTLSYGHGPFSVGLRWQYLPSLEPTPDASETAQGVASYQQFDWYGRWDLGSRYQLRAGIDNLMHEEPKPVGATPTDANLGSSINAHDVFGRRYYFGASMNF